eukprot:COSAG02_NODE_18540_length_933_cov_1.551559_1_plen_162_part_00
MAITEAELAYFVECGFVAVPRPLCPDSELDALRQEYDRLFAPVRDDNERVARQREGRHFDLGGPSELGDSADDVSKWALPQVLGPGLAQLAPTLVDNCDAIARKLLGAEDGWGPPSKLSDGHAILKPPRVGAATPWHQDDAVRAYVARVAVSVLAMNRTKS